MGRQYDHLDDDLVAWIGRQPVVFVGTAPLSADGHVNVSPKGHPETFQVIDEHTVAYLDLTGSGAETIAHARENGRVTIMFCAFEGPPNIVRLYGTARPVLAGDPGFEDLVARFAPQPGTRSVIVVDVTRVSDSCGYSIPFMRYDGERETLRKWSRKKGEDGMADYRVKRNAESIDGLPAVPTA